MTEVRMRIKSHQPSQCRTGKVCYPTEKDAEDALYILGFYLDARSRRIYFCKLCNQYHLTSKPFRDDNEKGKKRNK